MVLPVPGFPTNTRCRPVSMVGRSRSRAQLLHAEEVGEQLDLLLHLGQADQRVELGQQLLDGARSARRRVAAAVADG